MKKVVLFASGSGSNVQRICEYFKDNAAVSFPHLFCNKKEAYVLERAKQLGLDATVFNRDDFYKGDKILNQLKEIQPDIIVLAGFLWLMPEDIVKAFPNAIINIHPALLPAYGGKGMYGMKVHQAVKDNKENQTGITIHYVNEEYDEGNIIFQQSCPLNATDTPKDIAAKVHALEYEHFPRVIEQLLFGEL